VANDPEARARAEIEAIRKSETSPGVLLASGYIAGGSLAGVAVAFLEFSQSLKQSFLKIGESLNEWSNRSLFSSPFEFTQGDALAIGFFAMLIAFLVLVGMGKLLPPPEDVTNS
jgi:hypothetical protein